MEIQSIPIPTLHGGITEQPEKIRRSFQVEDSENVIHTIDKGLKLKRPPSRQLGFINNIDHSGTTFFSKILETSEGGHFLLVVRAPLVGQSPIAIYNLDGTPVSTSITSEASDYLKSNQGSFLTKDMYKVTSVLDSSFILNRTKKVASKSFSPSNPLIGLSSSGLVYMRSYVESQVVTTNIKLETGSVNSSNPNIIVLDSFTITTNTGTGSNTKIVMNTFSNDATSGVNAAAPHIRSYIKDSLVNLQPFSATVNHGGSTYQCIQSHISSAGNEPGTPGGSSYWQVITGGTLNQPSWDIGGVNYYYIGDFADVGLVIKVESTDTYGNTLFDTFSSIKLDKTASFGANSYVLIANSLQDLPPNPNFPVVPTYEYPVFQLEEHYFVWYDPEKGNYVECSPAGYCEGIDNTTMPVKLLYDAVANSFLCDVVEDYEEHYRKVGDDVSSPNPLFIGNTINDMCFFRNRLTFLAGESFSMSRSQGNYFSFYNQTAREVLASDPISSKPDSNTLNILEYATPASGNLLVSAKENSFLIHSGNDPMGPNTVMGDKALTLTLRGVPPIRIGSSVFMMEDSGDNTSVERFDITKDSVSSDSFSVTSHVQSLIPEDIQRMVAVPSKSMLISYPWGQYKAYVYKYYINPEGQLTQSAWFKLKLSGTIETIERITGTEIVVLVRDPSTAGSQYFIESIDLSYKNTEASNRFLYCLDRGFKSSVTNGVLNTTHQIREGLVAIEQNTGIKYNVTLNTPLQGIVEGYPTGDFYFGYPYESYISLTPPFPKDENGVPLAGVDTQVLDIRVDYFGGIFNLVVQPKERAERTYESLLYRQEGQVIGSVDLVESNKDHNPTVFLVYGRSKGLELKISSDNHTPLTVQGLEYKVGFTKREST